MSIVSNIIRQIAGPELDDAEKNYQREAIALVGGLSLLSFVLYAIVFALLGERLSSYLFVAAIPVTLFAGWRYRSTGRSGPNLLIVAATIFALLEAQSYRQGGITAPAGLRCLLASRCLNTS
jgi:hypothetical protein